MNRASTPVRSSQDPVHPRLSAVVCRHLQSPWLQPLHRPTVGAFERLCALSGFDPRKGLVFDSGCGTGHSTRLMAQRHPDCLVIGIDRSASRLSRLGRSDLPFREENAFWVQGELASFWRLALERGWRLRRHYLLYPNPWPKAAQVQRRWHGHPVFPHMLALGGKLELRCNWRTYAEEFRLALQLARPGVVTNMECAESELDWGAIETPFGRKYGRSGHQLYRLTADLG